MKYYLIKVVTYKHSNTTVIDIYQKNSGEYYINTVFHVNCSIKIEQNRIIVKAISSKDVLLDTTLSNCKIIFSEV